MPECLLPSFGQLPTKPPNLMTDVCSVPRGPEIPSTDRKLMRASVGLYNLWQSTSRYLVRPSKMLQSFQTFLEVLFLWLSHEPINISGKRNRLRIPAPTGCWHSEKGFFSSETKYASLSDITSVAPAECPVILFRWRTRVKAQSS